ncbi:hypothetical protein BJF78_35375 [Pseudonocardia sp. CNS-139]|nr:hypothetical protein BJF78_35375 [Pseudonocardia sp. CNS-139]
MVGGALVAGVGGTIGVLRFSGFPAWRFPDWAPAALRGTATALAGLAFVGALMLVTGLALAAPRVADAYAQLAPDVLSGVGVTVLALAYLPNALLAGVSWALGPGVAVGTAGSSPFVTHAPDQPSSFPLLTAFPVAAPPVWALAVFVLPVAVGLLAGFALRRVAGVHHFAAAVATALLTTLVVTTLAALAGGRLAAGPFDPVRLPVELVVPSVLLWVGVPVVLVALFRPAVAPPEPEPEPEPEPPVTSVPAPRDAGDEPAPEPAPERAAPLRIARRLPAVTERVARHWPWPRRPAAAPPVLPQQRGPQTVAELVAQREREAAEHPAADDPTP